MLLYHLGQHHPDQVGPYLDQPSSTHPLPPCAIKPTVLNRRHSLNLNPPTLTYRGPSSPCYVALMAYESAFAR